MRGHHGRHDERSAGKALCPRALFQSFPLSILTSLRRAVFSGLPPGKGQAAVTSRSLHIKLQSGQKGEKRPATLSKWDSGSFIRNSGMDALSSSTEISWKSLSKNQAARKLWEASLKPFRAFLRLLRSAQGRKAAHRPSGAPAQAWTFRSMP